MDEILGHGSSDYRSCNKCDYFVHGSLSYIDRDTAGYSHPVSVSRSKRICKFLCLFRRIEESAIVIVSIKANHFDFFVLLHLLSTHQEMWLFLSCNYQ